MKQKFCLLATFALAYKSWLKLKLKSSQDYNIFDWNLRITAEDNSFIYTAKNA